jgi:hypothetical protein
MKKISWMWISKSAADTAQFRRLGGPSFSDLLLPGLISMGLVILAWVVERWLGGSL